MRAVVTGNPVSWVLGSRLLLSSRRLVPVFISSRLFSSENLALVSHCRGIFYIYI